MEDAAGTEALLADEKALAALAEQVAPRDAYVVVDDLVVLPADVPTTRSGLIPASSSTSMTPTWAKPRAAPPPSASPTRGGTFCTAAGAGCGVTGAWAAGFGATAQPARTTSTSAHLSWIKTGVK